jgi:hypothetical protein
VITGEEAGVAAAREMRVAEKLRSEDNRTITNKCNDNRVAQEMIEWIRNGCPVKDDQEKDSNKSPQLILLLWS